MNLRQARAPGRVLMPLTEVRDRLDAVDNHFDALMELLDKCEEAPIHAAAIAILFKPLFKEVRAISSDLTDMRL